MLKILKLGSEEIIEGPVVGIEIELNGEVVSISFDRRDMMICTERGVSILNHQMSSNRLAIRLLSSKIFNH